MDGAYVQGLFFFFALCDRIQNKLWGENLLFFG